MAYNDELIKLRSRLIDAVQLGLVEKGSADAFEAVLSQIMTDAEKNKQNYLVQADHLKKQAALLEGQAMAFASISNIVYSALNGYVVAVENIKSVLAQDTNNVINENATETLTETDKKE